jgi:hypothetical protein
METAKVRRRHSTFAAGLASMAMVLGLAAIPAGAAPQPREVDYVALGDSYTAGTGAVSRIDNIFPPFVPTPPCTQTEGGYVDLVDTVDAVDLEDNAACHGALIRGLSADGARCIPAPPPPPTPAPRPSGRQPLPCRPRVPTWCGHWEPSTGRLPPPR